MGNDAASAGTLTALAEVDSDALAERNDTEHEQPFVDEVNEDSPATASAARGSRWSRLCHPMASGIVAVVVLSALAGWLGFGYYQVNQAHTMSQEFLQTARQAALNLTTIDWRHADEDVHRIVDGATGDFYDEFAQRAQPFIEVVKQAKSVSVGTITEAGLESQSGSEAQALVAVSVKTSNAGGGDPTPRAWRMRISVQKLADQLKVSRVEFVA
jgi:Mce-associated membrane protein